MTIVLELCQNRTVLGAFPSPTIRGIASSTAKFMNGLSGCSTSTSRHVSMVTPPSLRVLLSQNHQKKPLDLGLPFHGKTDQPTVAAPALAMEHPPTSSQASQDSLQEPEKNR